MKRCSSRLTLQNAVKYTEPMIAVLLPFLPFLNWYFQLQLFCSLLLVLYIKYVRYFCIFHLAYRVNLHPYLGKMDTEQQI